MPKRTHPGSELRDDDGLIDELAVEILLTGSRRIRVTRAERVAAALRLWDEGVRDEFQIRYRLGLSPGTLNTVLTAMHEQLAARTPLAG